MSPAMRFDRKAIAGVLIALMALGAMAAGIFPSLSDHEPFWLSGVFAFAAAILLLPELGTAQRVQLGLLLGVGMLLLLVGYLNGASINWTRVIAQNTGLLSMIVSVGMLKLVVGHGAAAARKLPTGRRAFWHTLVSLSIFGSVINISAPILIGDRLTLNRCMDMFTAAALTRTFCMCSAWSPFFAGTAVVLTTVAGVRISDIVVGALPLMLIAVAWQYIVAVWLQPDKLQRFHGYPIQLDSLMIPITLASIVLLATLLFPAMSILVIIAIAAIAMASLRLVQLTGLRQTAQTLVTFVQKELPRSVNELQLFLSAGVLAAGLGAMVDVGSLQAPISQFDAGSASLLLAMMVVISAFGLHPVIQIAALTPLLSVAEPEPALLALTYMFAWALGTCASPLSGTNLVMQGRFGIVAWRGAVQNWPFVGVMYLASVGLLYLSGF